MKLPLLTLLLALTVNGAPATDYDDSGFTSLFNGRDLSSWFQPAPHGRGYVVENGLLVCPADGGGDMYARFVYSNFIFRFEFRLEEGSNNGIGIRAPGTGDAAYRGMEIQILDDDAPVYRGKLRPAQRHGSIYDVVAAKTGHLKKTGEWNDEEIYADGRHIRVTLNGAVIVDANLDSVTDPEVLKRHPGLARTGGFIGLLGHDSRVEFRNLRVRPLSEASLSGASFGEDAKAQEVDCPAAYRGYSSGGTPLLDLLLNPAAKAVVERDLPGFLAKLPPILTKPAPPTLADILTIRIMSSEFSPIPEEALDKLDKDLALVPVTREAAVTRCARYDHTPPVLPEKFKHPAMLVFSKSNGFRDDPSVNAAEAALKTMAAHEHWSMFFTENAAVFNASDLKRFDVVVWNNVSGDVLTLEQRNNLMAYMENGGGFAGVHGSGGDFFYDWDWYADTLIGARFKAHPMSPQFQAAKLKVDDRKNPIVGGLAQEWTMTDEWYSFKTNPRKNGADVLVTLDESTYTPMAGKVDLRMGDHPIAWTRCIGKGRSFYTAIGHRPEGYTEPNTNRLIQQGVAWAAGLGKIGCPAE